VTNEFTVKHADRHQDKMIIKPPAVYSTYSNLPTYT